MKLTEKQKRFCEEYLIDLNATQAANRAGYKNTEIGRQLITKNNVLEYLSELRSKQSERTQITADRVLKELAAIAFTDRTELARVNEQGNVSITPTDELAENTRKAIAGIKEGKNGIEVSSYDKLKALELIGKHIGMFVDKIQVDNPAEEEKAKKLDNIANILNQIKPIKDGDV